MNDKQAVFRCQRQACFDTVQVFAFNRAPAGRITFWKMVPGEQVGEGDFFGEPSFSLDRTQAQELIDELWRAGLRPTEGSGSAGSLAATERHLKDMQGIAIALLRKDGAQV